VNKKLIKMYFSLALKALNRVEEHDTITGCKAAARCAREYLDEALLELSGPGLAEIEESADVG
jgi:hypothetical protein